MECLWKIFQPFFQNFGNVEGFINSMSLKDILFHITNFGNVEEIINDIWHRFVVVITTA